MRHVTIANTITQLVETCSRSYPELSVQTELSSGRKWSLACIPMHFPRFAKSLVCCQRLRHNDELEHEKIV